MDTEIIAIAQEEDDHTTMARVEEFVQSDFPVVADTAHVTDSFIKRFGVYLVDKRGVIRVAFTGTKTARPRLDMLIEEIARIEKVEAPEMKIVEGKVIVEDDEPEKPKKKSNEKVEILDIRWMWSHDRITPGETVKLAFCPVIADGFHVYAPWEKQMVPFKVELEIPKGLTLQNTLSYPESESFDDPAMGMTLLVYHHDIPLSTLVFKADEKLKLGDLKLTAKVTYQACNNKVCHRPTTIKKQMTLKADKKGARMREVYGWGRW